MDIFLDKTTFKGKHELNICGSKSESNRLLVLQALFPKLKIKNLSTSDDTIVLSKALKEHAEHIDIHHAGTAMRFLTAYFAFYTPKPVILTGSERMQNRPIKILVDALQSLGSKIDYIDKAGYPPLKIYPAQVLKNEVKLQADISSQYISALMLSATQLPEGLRISFTSKITSLPYIKMTVDLMKKLGFDVSFNTTSIHVKPIKAEISKTIDVESDWSSASYFYSLVALSPDLKLKLSTFKRDSLQGDSKLSALYEPLGVKTKYIGHSIVLENTGKISDTLYQHDLNHTPDLAQTIAVTCLGLKKACELSGLHTLKIKETDRLVAMKTEIEKFGARVEIDDKHLKLSPSDNLKPNQNIDTYNDHRMAMAFAPLCTQTSLSINNAEVVTKSYPDFWKDFNRLSEGHNI